MTYQELERANKLKQDMDTNTRIIEELEEARAHGKLGLVDPWFSPERKIVELRSPFWLNAVIDLLVGHLDRERWKLDEEFRKIGERKETE